MQMDPKNWFKCHQPSDLSHRRCLQWISAFCSLWNCLTLEGWRRGRRHDADAKFPKRVSSFGKQSPDTSPPSLLRHWGLWGITQKRKEFSTLVQKGTDSILQAAIFKITSAGWIFSFQKLIWWKHGLFEGRDMVFLPSMSQLFPQLNRETCRWGYVGTCRQLRAVHSFAGSAPNIPSLLLENS